MEQNAQSQTQAIELQTQSVNQERFKDAIAHLSNEKESVRLGGIYTLAHLGRDQNEKYLTTVIEIISAHLRTTTQDPDYQKAYTKQPSNEVQSALDLLFRKGEGSLHQKGSSMIIDLSQSFFKGASLAKAFLNKVNFQQSKLQNAHFNDAQLQGANLYQAKLQGANLFKTQLQGAFLWQAQLQVVYLAEARLQGADLRQAQLQGVYLAKARLQGANLFKTQLQGATLWQTQLQEANLGEAQLQGADLGGARLQGAYLVEVQLQGAIFRTTQLGGVESSDSLSSINFEERIKAGIEKAGDLQTLLFSGGIPLEEANKSELRLRKLIEAYSTHLSKNWAKGFAEQMEKVIAIYHEHSGKKAVHDLPEGAENIPYTQEQAEQWITEYKEAMKDVEGEGND